MWRSNKVCLLSTRSTGPVFNTDDFQLVELGTGDDGRWDDYKDFSDTGSVFETASGADTAYGEDLARNFEVREPPPPQQQQQQQQLEGGRGSNRGDWEGADTTQRFSKERNAGNSGGGGGSDRGEGSGGRDRRPFTPPLRMVDESKPDVIEFGDVRPVDYLVPNARIGGASNSVDWGSNAVKGYESARNFNRERRGRGGGSGGGRSAPRSARDIAGTGRGGQRGERFPSERRVVVDDRRGGRASNSPQPSAFVDEEGSGWAGEAARSPSESGGSMDRISGRSDEESISGGSGSGSGDSGGRLRARRTYGDDQGYAQEDEKGKRGMFDNSSRNSNNGGGGGGGDSLFGDYFSADRVEKRPFTQERFREHSPERFQERSQWSPQREAIGWADAGWGNEQQQQRQPLQGRRGDGRGDSVDDYGGQRPAAGRQAQGSSRGARGGDGGGGGGSDRRVDRWDDGGAWGGVEQEEGMGSRAWLRDSEGADRGEEGGRRKGSLPNWKVGAEGVLECAQMNLKRNQDVSCD